MSVSNYVLYPVLTEALVILAGENMPGSHWENKFVYVFPIYIYKQTNISMVKIPLNRLDKYYEETTLSNLHFNA